MYWKEKQRIKFSFTVRKISSGEGVERVFPLYSNVIESIERIKVGDVRRAKLYYLRELSGKKARIAERTDGRSYDDDQYISTIKDIEAAPEEQPAEETPAAEEAPVAVEEKVEAAPQEEAKEEAPAPEEAPAASEEAPAEEPEAKN